MCFIVIIFNEFKKSFCTWWLFVWFFSIFYFIIPKFHFNSEFNAWPILHNPFNNPLTPKFKNWLIFISMFFYCKEEHVIHSLQTYVQKMNINANFRGLWCDNHAIFCLVNYLHRPIHVCSKNNYVIGFRMDDDFISNSTLQLL